MDIKDLMIGDWVYNKHHGKNIQITPYDFFTHKHDEYGTQALLPCAKPTFGGDLEPIPLTEDIIEAHGFMKIPQPKCHFPHHWAFDKTDDDDEEAFTYRIKAFNTIWRGMRIDIRNCINDTVLSVQCQFVHELQHALRLCGIDLEIKL